MEYQDEPTTAEVEAECQRWLAAQAADSYANYLRDSLETGGCDDSQAYGRGIDRD